MKDVLDSVAFSAGGRDYLWSEVVNAPINHEAWTGLQARARESQALLAWAEGQQDDPVAPKALEQAMDEFRYARDLVAADELERWLDSWGIDEDAWLGFIRASLLRKQGRSEPVPAVDLTDARLEYATRVEAICGGDLFRLGSRLAGRVAVFERVRRKTAMALPPDGALPSFEEFESAFQEFEARLATDEAIKSRIRIRRSDWSRVTRRLLVSPREEVAREALLSVREDGLTLEEVAAEAGLAVDESTSLLVELPAAERGLLQAAQAGELLGPFAHGEGFGLILVVERSAPDPDDAGMQARARREIIDEAVRREVEDRVTWR